MNNKKLLKSGIPVMITVIVLLTIVYSFSQEAKPLKADIDRQKLISRLENIIPRLMKKTLTPGLSVALIRDAEIVWGKDFGVKNAKTGEPVTKNTIFEAASLSKPVFAYAVLQIVENGDMDLDVPLLDFVPDEYIEENFLNEKIKDERIRQITTRMIMSHTPGFPNWRRNRRGGGLTINSTPGKRFSYSGEGFVFLQHAVEYLKGKPLNDMMTEYVLEPRVMEHSSYVWRDEYESMAAVGHSMFGETTGRFRKRTKANAAASLYTTASDYAKFMIALMEEKNLEDFTVREMLSPQIHTGIDLRRSRQGISGHIFWGLGFGLQHVNGQHAYWHWGDNGTFRCYAAAYKEEKTGIVFFTNGTNGYILTEDLLEEAVGGEHPACKWLGFVSSDDPVVTFMRTIAEEDSNEALKTYYALKDKYTKEDEPFPEDTMNRLGYELLRGNKIDKAIEVFKLNVEAYPESANVYDSLAEAYMKNGDTELAIKFYRKTLELNPDNPGAKRNLKKLERK